MDRIDVEADDDFQVLAPLAGVVPDVQHDSEPKGTLRWQVTIDSEGRITVPVEFAGAFFRDRLNWEGEQAKKKPRDKPPQSEPRVVNPDSYVDQRSGLVDKRMYLRLARERAFPSKKIGKRVVARWADVQAALSVKDTEDAPTEPRTEEEAMRLRWGLARRS